MKRFLLTFGVFLLAIGLTIAQRTITGTVTDQNGEPLIGANVLAVGTSVGTVTDIDGAFEIEIPAEVTNLIISYTGYTTQEVALGASNIVSIVLAEGVTLSEAIVTGLSIVRDEKTLSYGAQQVQGEALNPVVNQNVIEGLAGKVAGAQVINTSGAALGGTSKIRIRGATGLTGGEPLFVVDGTPLANRNYSGGDELTGGREYGSLINDLNPDDIENISVLKGPAGTAIYGERGKHGVIMITLKKGKAREGIGVTVNSSVTAERVYIIPDYQNEYGGGYTQEFLKDPASGHNILNYAADESWGPRMDGTLYRPWWSWYPGTPDFGTQIPLSPQPDNVRDFFETGMAFNNSVAIEGGNANTTFRLSFKNVNHEGVLPNSKLITNNIGVAASTKLTERLEVATGINFATENGRGRAGFGYSGHINPVMSFNQWFQRQLDIDRLRDYKNPDGSFRSWNIRSTTNLRPLYWDSPYFTAFENAPTDTRDRYFGNIRATYKLTDQLTVSGAIHRDNFTQRIEERNASGGLDLSQYNERVANGREDNFEARVDYSNRFGSFTVDVNVGANKRKNIYHENFAGTAGGLNAPNLFNLSASTDRPTVTSFISEKTVNSVFGAASVGFNDWIYVNGTLRNDWSSALPVDNASYLYPSVGLSFVFSEVLNSVANIPWLSYAKLRGSYAQVGSDIEPYQTAFTYGPGTPYGSLPSFGLPNTLVNSEIKPALSQSWEVGMDVRMFQNRVGFDVNYYNTNARDEILQLQVPATSGFTAAWINAGNIQTRGFEVTLYATPVESRDFSWDFTFNIGTNKSTVKELSEGLDNYTLDGRTWGSLTVNAPVDQEWGQFRGTAFKRDDQGRMVLNEDGVPQTVLNQWMGTFLPDATGGFRTDFNFKGFHLGAFVDFQIGGQFHSITKMFNAYSGLAAETAGLNDKGNPVRDPVDQGGGVRMDGVLENGTPVTIYTDAQNLFESEYFALHEKWLYDATYVKLREVSLGYNLPSSILSNTPIRTIGISLVAKNLWLIHSEVDGIDPSEISPGSNNYVFQEGGQLPGVRSFGVNLRLGF